MSQKTVLLVDDSKSARYALRLQLQKQNISVDTAESAEVALQRVKANPPDAIFMDHMMPGMNGFEALEALKKDPETSAIPVIMCTSNDDAEYQHQARDKGALGILTKGAAADKLPAVLAEIDAALVHGLPSEPVAQPGSKLNTAAIAEVARQEASALIESAVEPRVRELFGRSTERFRDHLVREVLQRAEQGFGEWLEDEIKQLREELLQLEKEHAHQVSERLSQEVLQLVQQKLETESDRLTTLVEKQYDRLTAELPEDTRLLHRILETAESAADSRAVEAARREAHLVAEVTANDKAGKVADRLLYSAQSAVKRMYLLASGAALVGVAAAAVVYILK